mgnify:FL=1
MVGLFYGGGFKLLGLQCLGIITVVAWAAVTVTITFLVIRATVGLRVTKEEEIIGLDQTEHGMVSAYADFALVSGVNNFGGSVIEDMRMAESVNGSKENMVSPDEAVPVQLRTADPSIAVASDVSLTKITIIMKQQRFDALKDALDKIGVTGMTVTNVLGCGTQHGRKEYYRGVEMDITLLPKIQVDIVVSQVSPRLVVDTAKKVLYTGHIGDGKIFVYNVANVIKVRTGEEGYEALQGEDDL